MKNPNVSWTEYAKKYDMLVQYNPYYQDLQQEVLDMTSDWKIKSGDLILDIGAGTGNYSIPMASKFPQAKLYHIDRDFGMNAVAKEKRKAECLSNIEIKTAGVEALDFSEGSVTAITCIHSLYTFADPTLVLQNIYKWLKPGGYGIFVDPGRLVNVFNWQLAIGIQMLKKYGLKKTLEIMKEGKEVSKQNREISKLQAKGIYWTHTHKEFCKIISDIGFEIIEAGTTFRKISDFVYVKKS